MFKFNPVNFPILMLAAAGALLVQDMLVQDMLAQDSASLTPEQTQALREKVKAFETNAKAETEKQTAKIAEIARNIDRNLLAGNPDAQLDRKLSADFATEVTAMVSGAIQAKLTASKEMVKLLTPGQKAALLAELDKPGANPDITELINKVLAKR